MYNAQITKKRIKELSKEKGISMENLLNSCDLGVNAVRQINDNKGMASHSLAKIADYLDVSVDYLLGRTEDKPGSAAAPLVSSPFAALSEEEIIIIEAFRSADAEGRMRITQAALNAKDAVETKNKTAV